MKSVRECSASLFARNSLQPTLLALAIAMGSLQCPDTGHAQGLTFTDRPAFEAALQSRTDVTFDDLTPMSGLGPGVASIESLGVTVSSADSQLYVFTGSDLIIPINGLGNYLANYQSDVPMGIQLPAGVNALGADFSGGYIPGFGFDATLTVDLLDGQSYNYAVPVQREQWTFFGVAFEQPIVSLVFDDGALAPGPIPPQEPAQHFEIIDTVAYGVVPEPHALGVAILALTVFLFRRRLCLA